MVSFPFQYVGAGVGVYLVTRQTPNPLLRIPYRLLWPKESRKVRFSATPPTARPLHHPVVFCWPKSLSAAYH